jgi:uncharacterized protein YndB with AHSA1/START domain
MVMTLERAKVSLPGDSQVMVTRSFNAGKALVYRAFTEPKLMQRWLLGPPGWTMPVCEMDVRVGGKFRWRWRSKDDGKEFGFHGVFKALKPEARLEHTQSYDPGDVGGDMGDEAIIVVEFSERNGVTTVTSLMDFGTKESRDAAVSTGMTDGMEQSYQQLDKVLAGPNADGRPTAT